MSRFLISCGGTGGHLSPGIALAEGLTGRGQEVDLLISRKKVDARLAEKYPQFTFTRVPGVPFSWNPMGFLRFFVEQTWAVLFAYAHISRTRPDCVIGFGGFTTAAAAVAAKLFRIPVVLHEANRVPGRATRALGRLASRVYLPPGVRISGVRPSIIRHYGLPVRLEIRRSGKQQARERLGLDPNLRVLAVLGGSQGATALNEWAVSHEELLALEGIQLYCVTGLDKGRPGGRQFRSAAGERVRSLFVPFCDSIGDLLSGADLVVSRAGAGTIAELIRCQIPAILVPYPFSKDDHQWGNARYFERQGGGLVINQDFLIDLHREVIDVIFNDWLLRRFRGNLLRMDRSQSLGQILEDLLGICRTSRRTPPGRDEDLAA